MRREDPTGQRPPRYSTAKLAAPRPPAHTIERPNLVALIDRELETGVCLVVGAAGTGKTNALLQWSATRSVDEICWVNVDEADVAPGRFWQAVVHAVRRVRSEFGDEALETLRSGGAGPDVVETLVDEFDDLDAPVVLVLDDLHLAHGEVDRTLGDLIARRPTGLRLVIGSRMEPQFDLGRFRASGAVGEVRDGDLLMGLDECRAMLAALGVSVGETTLEILWSRTEGWAAGIRLAAVAMQRADDPEGFVDRLVSSSWAVAHYLSDEVLSIQSPEVLDFMLDTCVVDVLTPELATALAGGSPVTLADLEAAHMMLYRSTAHPEIFHYHHLLREQLRLRLHSSDPERKRRQHRMAAAWYESTGDISASFTQLWRADDREQAMRLLSAHLWEVYLSESLPEFPTSGPTLTDVDVLRAPGSTVAVATLLCFHHRRQAAEDLVERIERLAGDRLEVDDRDQVTCVRTYNAAAVLDHEAVISHAADVLAMARRQGKAREGVVAAVSMIVRAHAWTGDWAAAEAAARAVLVDARPTVATIEMTAALAFLELFRGRLGEGIAHARRHLELVQETDVTRLSVASPGLVLLAWGLLERGYVGSARDLLEKLGSPTEQVRLPARTIADVTLSRLRAAGGDAPGALRALESARARLRHLERSSVAVSFVTQHEAYLAYVLGDHESSAKLADELPEGLPRDLALARLSLAEGDREAAGQLVDRASQRADGVRRELEVALARVAVAAGTPSDELVDDVISIGQHDGFVFALAEAGGDVFEAIQRRARRLPRTAYVDQILRTVPHVAMGRAHGAEVEPLTDREQDVLRHLATSLSYQEIAQELVVSVNTLKSHVKHTFRKLGASTREEALARGREAGYL